MEKENTPLEVCFMHLVQQRQHPAFSPNVALLLQQQYINRSTWGATGRYAPALPPVQIPQPQGISFGTFLAGVATVVSGVVLFDSKASKEAKAVAKIALGASMPFLLNKAFDLQALPGQQQWN